MRKTYSASADFNVSLELWNCGNDVDYISNLIESIQNKIAALIPSGIEAHITDADIEIFEED